LAFGLPEATLEQIGAQTDAGVEIGAQLEQSAPASIGLLPAHLLQIRRARRRYRALAEQARHVPSPGPIRDPAGLQAARFAERFGTTDAERTALAGAFAAVAATALQRGRLRSHARDPGRPLPGEFAALAEHSEDCAQLPPHRFFALGRAVSEGLLHVEVLPPDGEIERALGALGLAALVPELGRALAKAVLDQLSWRAEEEATAMAVSALLALLSRPPVDAPLAGVVADGRRLWAVILGGDCNGEQADFPAGQAERLGAWLGERRIAMVGLATAGRHASLSSPLRLLTGQGLTVELIREAGLMKQAEGPRGTLKAAAARVVAERLRDPLDGYADLPADALGLGEYLDRLDPDRLHAALEDARQAAVWERKTGKRSAPVVRGVAQNPMVQSLADLRPGMELSGTVVNLTHFGAFVELGLPVQGMIHLSELSDRFIKHPGEAVQVGQRVRARVLEVDLPRGRLALSLKPAGLPGRGKRGDQRAQAIKSLDALFKK
jgi:predicted RNA-binding protein with RPS1 domain